MRRIVRWVAILGAGVAGVLAAAALVIGFGFVPAAKQPPYQRVASWGDPGSAAGQFDGPNDIAVADDRVYVADSLNHRIQIFDLQGYFLSAIAVGPQGLLPQARPMNLNIAGDKLYVGDYWNDAVQVCTLDGRLTGTFGGKQGMGPGQFHAPGGASAEPDGTIIVVDFYNQRVQMLSPQGRFIRQIGATGHKGYVAGSSFNYPR
ncbi:MAG: hypothetical protein EPN71_07375, partial [Rhodanobacter sp.]